MAFLLQIILLGLGPIDRLSSQEISPIQIFTPQQTNAGNQNWMISQGEDQTVYFANNQGLLSYNASQWKLHPAKDNSIIRAVKTIDDRVYSMSLLISSLRCSKSFRLFSLEARSIKSTTIMPPISRRRNCLAISVAEIILTSMAVSS